MKLNCIIVEDNHVFRLMLEEMIKKGDFNLNLIAVAESAEEAQKLLKIHSIDLILLDLGLPGMNGFEFIETLEAPEDVQIILITGHKEHALEAFEYNVADYLVKPISKERLKKAVLKATHNRTEELQKESPENIIFKKLARFMVSRNIAVLEPVPLRSAKLGYAYPMLGSHYDFEAEEDALELLDEAETEGLLSGHFMDSIYVCNRCYNSLLHFRETCPNCNSSNLEAEDLVHHFSCAYVGPISDFYEKRDANNMVCPKCEKTLNHIGVDYDKPSVVYSCKKCDHTFQNPDVKGKCHHCGADSNVEHLIKKDIKKYEFTSAGKQVAKGDFNIALKAKSRLTDIMDESQLQRLLSKAINRKEESEEESCLAEMHFKNIAELYKRIGEERTDELLLDLYKIINQEIPVFDEIVFPNKETARFLLLHKNIDEAKDLLKDVAARLDELLQDNYDGFSVDILINIQQVNIRDTAQEQLNLLNKQPIKK